MFEPYIEVTGYKDKNIFLKNLLYFAFLDNPANLMHLSTDPKTLSSKLLWCINQNTLEAGMR